MADNIYEIPVNTIDGKETTLNDYKDKVLQQSIETIRNRIDEFGVSEPSISRQGSDRILVQLPGMADAERAKELINTTAKLDFMIVSNEVPTNQLQALIAEVEKEIQLSQFKIEADREVAEIMGTSKKKDNDLNTASIDLEFDEAVKNYKNSK